MELTKSCRLTDRPKSNCITASKREGVSFPFFIAQNAGKVVYRLKEEPPEGDQWFVYCDRSLTGDWSFVLGGQNDRTKKKKKKNHGETAKKAKTKAKTESTAKEQENKNDAAEMVKGIAAVLGGIAAVLTGLATLITAIGSLIK